MAAVLNTYHYLDEASTEKPVDNKNKKKSRARR